METKQTDTIDLAVTMIEDAIPQDQRGYMRIETNDLAVKSKALAITNKESYKAGIELALENAFMIKRLDAFKKAFLKPFESALKEAKLRFKRIEDVYSDNDEVIRTKLNSYQKKLSASTIEDIKTIHTDFGRATIMVRKDFEVLNPDIVPREYLKVDEEKIGRAVRAGLVKDGDIAGVKVLEAFSTSLSVGSPE